MAKLEKAKLSPSFKSCAVNPLNVTVGVVLHLVWFLKANWQADVVLKPPTTASESPNKPNVNRYNILS